MGDLHACNGDWGIDSFPIAPGHEIAGLVSAVGKNVGEFNIGQRVAVGCFVDSCKREDCDQCSNGFEQLCANAILTYGTKLPENAGHPEAAGYHTNGGYSTAITVHKRFVFSIPENMKMEVAGPLLCSGITMYSPLNRHVKGKLKRKVGIVGFGGLGHIGVKLAAAMGAEVFVFSRSTRSRPKQKRLGQILSFTQMRLRLRQLLEHLML